MPMPNPSIARPRMMLWDAARTSPVEPPVWLPSRITRICALLPSIAAVELGTDEIRVGLPIGIPPTVTVWMRMLAADSAGKVIGRDQVGNRFVRVGARKRDGQCARSRLGDRNVVRPQRPGPRACLNLLRRRIDKESAGSCRPEEARTWSG